MINIMIVDDDVLALTQLKQLINLTGVRVTGVFSQAGQALEFMATHRVDILITDMRMPKVDGIALIRGTKELKPDLQVIAVSSYEDFHYVKESFREGSIDYILKHALNEESITRALLDAISRVNDSRKEVLNSASTYNRSESFVEESTHALKTQLFTQLFKEEVSIEEAKLKLQKYDIQLHVGGAIVVVCEIDGYHKKTEGFGDKDRGIFLNSVTDLMGSVLARVPVKEIIRIVDGKYVLLLSYPHVRSQLFIYSSTYDYCKRLNDNLEKMLNIKLSISIGDICTDLADAVRSYHKCMSMLNNKLFEGEGQVYQAQQPMLPAQQDSKSSARIQMNQDEIYDRLNDADEQYVQSIDTIFNKFIVCKHPIQIIQLHLIDLLNVGFKVVKNNHLLKLQEEYSFNKLYQDIQASETVEEMRRMIHDFYASIVQAIISLKHMRHQRYNKHTISTIEIIERSFADSISLQDIADELGVHHTYLSKVFKSDTTLNFSEYLNQYRIDKAKQLIETGKYRLKEIYGRVGFNQYNYFFKVFRQVTGLTPTEYENQMPRL